MKYLTKIVLFFVWTDYIIFRFDIDKGFIYDIIFMLISMRISIFAKKD